MRVDEHLSILKLAASWQKAIVANLSQFHLSNAELKRDVSRLIIAVLALFLAERQRLGQPGQLKDLRESTDSYADLVQLWQTFCLRGNSFLKFELSPHLIDNQLLQEMIDQLYSSFQFTALPVEVLGQVYERILQSFETNSAAKEPLQPIHSRRSGGVYYTPKPIVQYMTKTIDRVFLPSSLSYILDCACGGGIFLLAAYQYLLDRQLKHYLTHDPEFNSALIQQSQTGQWQLSFAERQRLLSSIHGVDIDPEAVAVTQVSLWLKLFEDVSIDTPVSCIQTCLDQNIRCGNALIDSSPSSFNWQTAFPEIFAAGGFDLVIGNPPYVDAEQMTTRLADWRSYCTDHYQTATGNWDLFCVFVEKALQLCRPTGFSSLIVPNKLLSAHYAAATRSLLTQSSYLLSIRDYSQVSVFSASVYPVVYVAQKIAPTSDAETTYERMRTIHQVEDSYPVMLHQTQDAFYPWSLGVRSYTDLLQRLDQTLPKLEEMVRVTGAATVAEAYQLKPLIQDSATPALEDFRLVNSGTIDRYCLLWGYKPLRYLGQSYQHPIVSSAESQHLPPKRLSQAKQPKIIVAGMTQRLECALDQTGGILAGKSTSVIQAGTTETIDLCYLLALLNSRLISFYFMTCFGGNRLQGGYLRVGPPQLRQLPILIPNLEQKYELKIYQQLVELVRQRLKLLQPLKQCNHLRKVDLKKPQLIDLEIQQIEDEIDEKVYILYQLTDTEIEMVNQNRQSIETKYLQ